MVKLDYLDTGAQFSACDRYRYRLWRIWDESRPTVAFVGLNPSTADATKDDPTIRRCVRFADDHGYGGLVMLNLYAWRSTDPSALHTSDRSGEADNLAMISATVQTVARMVAAWGSHPLASPRGASLRSAVGGWWCLGTTKGGHPRPPLYVPAATRLVPWEVAA